LSFSIFGIEGQSGNRIDVGKRARKELRKRKDRLWSERDAARPLEPWFGAFVDPQAHTFVAL